MDASHDIQGNVDVDDGTSKAAGDSVSRVRRRNRMITSCLECRRRKLKCDRLHPCTNCSKGKRDCIFLAPSLDSATRLKLAELKERMGTLERSLEVEVTQTQPAEGESAMGDPDPSPVPEAEEADLLQPTGLAIMDAMYEDEADDIMVDLGIQLGKMRVTDRLGGLIRPRLVEEIAVRIKSETQLLLGQDIPDDDGNLEVAKMLELANQGFPLPFLQPGPSFIAPRSDMLVGSSSQQYYLLSLLPTKAAADKLLQQYWEACHPVARIVHRPTLESRYQLLWDDISQGIEPTPSIQAIVFATLFTAAVSMTPADVLNLFGVDQRALIESFQLGTESALGKAHFLRTTKTETLQAFVMYLIPMCRDTISRAHSALVGAAIRLAECMGLHRDPLEYNYGPVETHIRRLIWHQLGFLDIRTAESQGPRATIRSDEFTTKFPLNLNDDDLTAGAKEGSLGWTDMTFTRIRFECQEIIRQTLFDRMQLEKKTITITGGLAKIEQARKDMYERYGPIFSKIDLTPFQRATSVTMSFNLHRLHVMLLHKFYNSWMTRMPDRIVQVIINTGTQQLEDAVTLETAPELEPWRWYSRAYHNYHTALLLLVDVSAHPLRREADRIWRCLDYVYEVEDFDQSPNLTRRQIIEHRQNKAHRIMRQFRDRMRVYRTLRKIKYSAKVDDVKLEITKPPSLGTADPVSEATKSIAKFDLRPATFLPQQSIVDQARVRRTQYPSPGPISNLFSMTEPQSHSLGNQAENMSQFGQRNAPNMETVQGLPSNWTMAPSNTFAAITTPPNITSESSPQNSEDMSMPEIDWTEWDNMFPPHLNDGNLDLSPQTLSGTMQYNAEHTMFTFPYPPFNSKLF